MARRRLDTLLVDRGLAAGREKAQALVMAGQVRVNGHAAPKAGTLVEEDTLLEVSERARYVSRGGDKLEHALDAFGLDVTGLVAADIGASTGGFTDCLLQRGASRVYTVDTGKGQLDYRLRNDARVAVMEGVNARKLEALPEPVDFVAIDVSFISLTLVIPTARALLGSKPKGEGPYAPTTAAGSIVALFKPQFEARKHEVPHGGVIRDPQFHATLIGRFAGWCVSNRFRILDLTGSPILGADGNREVLVWLRPDPAVDWARPEGPHRGGARSRSSSAVALRRITRA
jgi:23S rRNA (cytidine1920-2'-O)/16S rRNA (cytidine1409-2'-O)-methyltransferase